MNNQDKIRELLAKATPRPWLPGGKDTDSAPWVVVTQDGKLICACSMSTGNDVERANVELIAEAVNSIEGSLNRIQNLEHQYQTHLDAMLESRAKDLTRIEQLEAALQKHGQHGEMCNAPYSRPSSGEFYPCTCGLDAAKDRS